MGDAVIYCKVGPRALAAPFSALTAPCLCFPILRYYCAHRALSAEPLPSWGGDTKVVGSVEDVTAEGLEGGFGLSFERQLSRA